MPRIIGSHMLLSAGEQALAQCFAGCVVHAANSARHFMSNTAHYTRDSLSSAHCCASRERRAGRARSDMRELLEEAGTGLARELAADFFAGHARAVVHQSAAMRVLQSRSGAGEAAVYKRCAGASGAVIASAAPAARR